MKYLIYALLIFSSPVLMGQEIIHWEGGTPGNESSWEEPKNWSGHKVPDEYSIVIIKHLNSGHNRQPIIKENVTVVAIEIHSRASLTLSPDATLVIDGEYTYSEGLVLFGGTFTNNGILIEKETKRNSIQHSLAFSDSNNK